MLTEQHKHYPTMLPSDPVPVLMAAENTCWNEKHVDPAFNAVPAPDALVKKRYKKSMLRFLNPLKWRL